MAVDPLGPESPEDEKPVKDGKPNGKEEKGGSISDQAQNGNGEAAIPPPPPLPGDKQMTLGSLGKRGTPVENRVSLMAASTEADGLFDPDSEGQLIVSYEPADYDYKPVRKDGKVVRWKLIQSLRVKSVTKVTPELAAAIAAVQEEHEMEPTPA